MNQYKITIAGESDIDTIAPMFDLYRQFYEKKSNPGLALEYIAQRIRRSESIIFMAEDSAGVGLGFCQLYPSFCSVEAAPIYMLYDLFVNPDYRRCGVGRALLLEAEAHAKARSVVRMDLTTAKDNVSAQALYESLGWVRDDVFFTYNRRMGG